MKPGIEAPQRCFSAASVHWSCSSSWAASSGPSRPYQRPQTPSGCHIRRSETKLFRRRSRHALTLVRSRAHPVLVGPWNVATSNAPRVLNAAPFGGISTHGESHPTGSEAAWTPFTTDAGRTSEGRAPSARRRPSWVIARSSPPGQKAKLRFSLSAALHTDERTEFQPEDGEFMRCADRSIVSCFRCFSASLRRPSPAMRSA